MQKNRLNIFVATFHYALAAAQLNFVLTMIIILQYHIKKQNNLRLLLLVEMSGGEKLLCWVKNGEHQNDGINLLIMKSQNLTGKKSSVCQVVVLKRFAIN